MVQHGLWPIRLEVRTMNDITLTAPNPSFSTLNPNLQLYWDSVSYNALCTCARFYQYSIIWGFTLDGPGNVHFEFGILLHSAAETYDRARAAGADHESALLSAFRWAVENTWDHNLKRPWVTDEPTKTRNTLLRTVVWYLDHYKDENLKTHILPDGRPAVELPFRFNLNQISPTGDFKSPDGEDYYYCGYLDKVVSWNVELWIRDIKTTKYELDDNYFIQYTPNNQVSGYSVAGSVVLHENVDGMIIDGIQVQVNGSKFRRKQIPRSKDTLEEWLRGFWYKIKEAERYAIDDEYPMNPKSCGFGRNQCQFRPVCSAEPNERLDMLNNFYKRHVWNPLEPR